MDMRLPVQIHPDLRPVVQRLADEEGHKLGDLVVEAIFLYLIETTIGDIVKPDAAWSQWATEVEGKGFDHSLPRDLSVLLRWRAREEGVGYLLALDRAIRYYIDCRIGMPS